MNNNGWILTDDDSQQHFKYLSNEEEKELREISLVEMRLLTFQEKKFEVYTDTLIVDDYLETMRGELEEILYSYGYKSIEDVANQYEDPVQIMAECIFEYYGSFQAEVIFVGNEQECIDFIQNYIDTH